MMGGKGMMGMMGKGGKAEGMGKGEYKAKLHCEPACCASIANKPINTS
jgi:hypothetical protein